MENIEPTKDEDELRVSTLEIFFDLIFVFIVTQFTALIAHHPLTGLLQSVLMLGFLWWMFAGYSWLTNVIPPVRPARRILVLVAMAGWLLVGMSVPVAFEEGEVWIAVGMLVVVVIHGLMYLQATKAVGPVFVANMAAVAAVFAAQLGPEGLWRHLLWALAAVIVWSVPIFHNQKGLTLHPGHITERHGLVVIVTLGESVVAISIGAAGLALDGDLLFAAILSLAVAACLWWALFVHEMPRTEEALAETSDQVQRVRKVLNGLSYAFIPVLLGIIVFAAGVEHAIGHATSPLDLTAMLLVSGGVAAFLLGTAWLRSAMALQRPLDRVCLAAAVLAVTPVGLYNAASQLGAIAIVLIGGLALEYRSRRLAARSLATGLGNHQGRGRLGVVDDPARQVEDLLDDVGGDDVGRGSLGDHRALAHRDQVRGVAGGLVEVVQHRHERAALPVELGAQVEDLELVGDVEVGRGLVEQQQRGLLGEHHRDPHPLPLAAGQLVDAPRGEVFDVGGLHGLGDDGLVLGRPLPQEALVRVAAAGDQVGDGDPVRRDRRLRQQAQALGDRPRGLGVDVAPVEQHPPGRGLQHARQGLEQGGLAAGVGADDDGELAFGEVDGEPFADGDAPVSDRGVPDGQRALRCDGHGMIPFLRCVASSHMR